MICSARGCAYESACTEEEFHSFSDIVISFGATLWTLCRPVVYSRASDGAAHQLVVWYCGKSFTTKAVRKWTCGAGAQRERVPADICASRGKTRWKKMNIHTLSNLKATWLSARLLHVDYSSKQMMWRAFFSLQTQLHANSLTLHWVTESLLFHFTCAFTTPRRLINVELSTAVSSWGSRAHWSLGQLSVRRGVPLGQDPSPSQRHTCTHRQTSQSLTNIHRQHRLVACLRTVGGNLRRRGENKQTPHRRACGQPLGMEARTFSLWNKWWRQI